MATSNPVCVECGREMDVAGIGWTVIYAAYAPPAPYQLRRGDLVKCDLCCAAVVTKFADGRPMDHFVGEQFETEVRTALATGKLVVVWERPPAPMVRTVAGIRAWLTAWLEECRVKRETAGRGA